jgi:hypothetical protein
VGWAFGTHGGGEVCLQGFGWETRRKRPLGRSRHMWEDNIKIDLREMGRTGFSWLMIGSSGGRL